MKESHISISVKIVGICHMVKKRSTKIYNSDTDGKNVVAYSCIDAALNKKYQKSDKNINNIASEKNTIFGFNKRI